MNVSKKFEFSSRLEWSYKVKNGGYVKVLNRETTTEETFFYEGQESTASYLYHFDTVKPTSANDEPLSAPDLTNSVSVNLNQCLELVSSFPMQNFFLACNL